MHNFILAQKMFSTRPRLKKKSIPQENNDFKVCSPRSKSLKAALRPQSIHSVNKKENVQSRNIVFFQDWRPLKTRIGSGVLFVSSSYWTIVILGLTEYPEWYGFIGTAVWWLLLMPIQDIFAKYNVGELTLLSDHKTLHITTYTMFGQPRKTEVPLSDITLVKSYDPK